MLEQGDWDTMRPLFRWMRSTLPLALERTAVYAKTDMAEFVNSTGAFWPETQWIFGLYEPVDYCLKFGSSRLNDASSGVGYCQPTPTTGHVGSKYARGGSSPLATASRRCLANVALPQHIGQTAPSYPL